MVRDVFISYSRKNLERVMEIKRQIDSYCKTDCWIDLKGIESGSEMFLRDIVGGINDCKVFLFMLSRESMESEYALKELGYASKAGKKVFLVNIDDCQMSGVFFFQYQFANIRVWNNQPQREALLRDVTRWVGGSQTIEPKVKEPLQEIEERIARLDKEVGELERFKDSNGKWGFKDSRGRVVIPCQWKYAEFFSEGLAFVQDSSGKWGFIDKSGRVVIPCQWKLAGDFSEGLALVEDSNRKYGYIDKSGRVVIPCQWEDAEYFSEGLAIVKDSSGKSGYIDMNGRVVSPCQWEGAAFFSGGLAKVKDSSGKFVYIDKTGKIVS